jgi:hypothetical protein
MNQFNLTPQQKAAFARVLARCNDCLPLLEYLEGMGVDVAELRERYDLQRQQAETALQLAGAMNGKT